MDFSLTLQQSLNGLAIGCVYAIFALGYTLIFSILRIINFAHASVFTLGAYFTYVLIGGSFGFNGLLANGHLPIALPFLVALALGAALAGLVSMAIERLAFKPLRARGADPLLTLVSSLGVAIVTVNVIQYLVGAEIYAFPSSVLSGLPAAINFGTSERVIPIRTIQIVILVVSVLIMIGLTLFVDRTRAGKALKAIAEDPTMAGLLGINADQLIMATFFISGFVGGLAGTLVGLSVSIAGPYFGIAFGLKGLAVIVLGGLGSIPGSILGGIVIGLAEAFVPSSAIAIKEAVPFVILFVILVMRPQGLLGRAAIQKV